VKFAPWIGWGYNARLFLMSSSSSSSTTDYGFLLYVLLRVMALVWLVVRVCGVFLLCAILGLGVCARDVV
jgi:hypothetical protein